MRQKFWEGVNTATFVLSILVFDLKNAKKYLIIKLTI